MSDSFDGQESVKAGVVYGDCEATVTLDCGEIIVIKKPGLMDFYEVLKFVEKAFDGLDFIRKGIEDASNGDNSAFSDENVKRFLASCVEKFPSFVGLMATITENKINDARMKQRGRNAMTLGDLGNVCTALWNLAELGKYLNRFLPSVRGGAEKAKRGRASRKSGLESGTSSEASTEPSLANN